jgi:hypothetical protein
VSYTFQSNIFMVLSMSKTFVYYNEWIEWEEKTLAFVRATFLVSLKNGQKGIIN